MTNPTATPHDDATRQRALDRYHVLDSLPETAYDDIVQLASSLCGTPTALITLIDRDRQWFKAKTGFETTKTSRLGERTTDKLLQRLDDVLEQTLAAGDDAITRSSGSGSSAEFIAVLHGEHAPQTLELLRAPIAHEADPQEFQLYGVAHGNTSESTAAVLLRADADPIDCRTTKPQH